MLIASLNPLRRLFVAALLAAAPAAASAQAPAPAAADPQASLALELAKLVSPSEALLELVIASARTAFFGALNSDPESQALEKDHPGIGQAVWDALEPEARRAAVESAPQLWEKIARVYTKNLTPAETRALIDFYGSPTGQKAIRAMYASVDMAPMFKDAIDSPDGQISAGSLAKGQRAAAAQAVSAMGPEDEAALLALSRAIPLAKLLAVGQDVQKATLEYLNEPDPENDARIEALVSETMERYMKKGAKRGR